VPCTSKPPPVLILPAHWESNSKNGGSGGRESARLRSRQALSWRFTFDMEAARLVRAVGNLEVTCREFSPIVIIIIIVVVVVGFAAWFGRSPIIIVIVIVIVIIIIIIKASPSMTILPGSSLLL
jgi:hypothetical protein